MPASDPGRLQPPDQRTAARERRRRNDDRAGHGRRRRGNRERDGRHGHEPRGLRRERRVRAQRNGRGLDPGNEGRRGREERRCGRLPLHECQTRNAAIPEPSGAHSAPPEPTPTPPTPIPPLPPGPKPLLDLEVVKSGQPAAVHIGGRITWTMTVTNRSSVAAADVNGLKVNDPRSFRTSLISMKSSQGTCRPYVCNLGRLAPGASATVVAVTRALRIGPVVDIVRVGSEEIESNYHNNVASALVRVVGPFRPPKTSDGVPDIDGGAARAPGRADLGRAPDGAKPSRSSAGRLPRACSRRRHRGSRAHQSARNRPDDHRADTGRADRVRRGKAAGSPRTADMHHGTGTGH